jgi:hypothetical protein
MFHDLIDNPGHALTLLLRLNGTRVKLFLDSYGAGNESASGRGFF